MYLLLTHHLPAAVCTCASIRAPPSDFGQCNLACTSCTTSSPLESTLIVPPSNNIAASLRNSISHPYMKPFASIARTCHSISSSLSRFQPYSSSSPHLTPRIRSIPLHTQQRTSTSNSNDNRTTQKNMSSSTSTDPSPPQQEQKPTQSFPPAQLHDLLTQISDLLKSRNESVSIAETACGGLISSSLLSTPGASKFYKGGLTLYTLPSRISYAGWTQETIANYKGPTTDIVSGLAKHVRGELGSTYTLSESGTAGPTGGNTPNRTPGYVALAVACERGVFTREVETGLGGDRVGNMVKFAEEGLRLLLEVVIGEGRGNHGPGFVSKA